MRTPDQVRLQLERCADVDGACPGCLQLIAVLHAVLPALIQENSDNRRALHLSELSRGTPSVYEDAGRRYGERKTGEGSAQYIGDGKWRM